ncbi:hypothetical protein ANN_20429 [Periplaneta americana]|uniref:RNase H type-1 domain-containing protein n=1 Tax=Periplaneta americana TaxID=6978 RepID=A0ABQ8SD86_PERAM|nr:hypothetical protein ANN_20429 [Periplaneta americana]
MSSERSDDVLKRVFVQEGDILGICARQLTISLPSLKQTEEILKSEVNTEILKQLSLETINIRYPPQNWLHLYTDGSLISREQGAGAGVTCCLFSLYRSLGYGTTSFDGEIVAISESLRNLLCHINKFKNAVILSDSKAAILSVVSKHTPSSQTAEITKMLSQLISLNKRIVFQWISSHCGILGNENADALAKKGSTATYRPVTKSTVNTNLAQDFDIAISILYHVRRARCTQTYFHFAGTSSTTCIYISSRWGEAISFDGVLLIETMLPLVTGCRGDARREHKVVEYVPGDTAGGFDWRQYHFLTPASLHQPPTCP